MKQWKDSEYPDVLKTLILTEDEKRRYRTQVRLSNRVRERLTEILHTLIAEELAMEDEAWDELAKRFGFDDLYALQVAGCALSMSWITGNVALRGKKPLEPQEEDSAPAAS